MNVRSSTRATSVGSERARKLAGRSAGFNRIIVPGPTISSHSRSYSACEPSHQWMWSGFASAAIFATHSIAPAWRT